jgi:prepilin peptidase CpaA
MLGFGPDAWAYAVAAVTLVVASVTDIRRGRIYNWTTYPAIAVGLIGHSVLGGVTGHDGHMGLLGSLAGLAIGFGFPLLAWLAGGIGGGDAKLMGAVGALTGWRFALATLVYGLVAAALLALLAMLRHRIVKDTMGRVLRFLYLLVLRARPSDPSTPNSPTIPFGLAFAIGAAVAMVFAALWGPDSAGLLF